MAEEVMIDLENLRNALDAKNYTSKVTLDIIKNIKDAVKAADIDDAVIAEIEALIYYELGEYTLSVEAFDELRNVENAKFSVSSLEKYCNARCKKYVEDCKSEKDAPEMINKMRSIIGELEALSAIKKTAERTNLMGSAFKRIGFLSIKPADKLSAFKDAATAYSKAYENNGDRYAFKNMLLMQCVYDYGVSGTSKTVMQDTKGKKAIIDTLLEQKKSLNPQYRNLDYWEFIEEACIDFLLLMLDKKEGKNDDNWKALEKKYKRIWKRAGSKGKTKAEIENFDIVENALGISKDKYAEFLKNKVTELRDNLKKFIAD